MKKKMSCGVDPIGKVFETDGKIFRQFDEDVYPFYKVIIDNGIIMENLVKKGLVESWIPPVENTGLKNVLEHKKVKYISYSIEWSFDMLKDAALKTIEIYEELLKNNYGMKDAHPYNILFDYSKITFVDISSVIKFDRKIHSKGWNRSFFGEFYLPLCLFKNNYKKLYSHYFYWENKPKSKERFFVFLNELYGKWNKCFDLNNDNPIKDLERVSTLIRGMELKYDTMWQDYYLRGEKIILGDERTYTNKEKSALNYLLKLQKENTSILDIASNEGWFALAAEKMGYEVIAFDYDERAINNLYLNIRESGKKILPVVMNFLSPTKTHGIQNNWPSAVDRFKCDITMSMAIIHHLVLSQNLSFEDFAGKISDFTRNYAVVEFIDRDDVHIKKRLKDWYTKENFLKAMGKHFALIDCQPSEPATRFVFLFKKLNE